MATYDQPTKVRARTLALSHAVELLTKRRENAAVIPKDYVTRVKKTLCERVNTFDADIAEVCDERLIEDWETLWDSKVGRKSPSEITVAYLAGPEPLNDFRELIRLGVHPNNIFGFESDTKEFNQALTSAKSSEFPLLKIIKMPLERYLQAVPMTFDIIYFDACGPFPSLNQRTLGTVATIFRYQRLNPLSVLITNFSAPDLSNTDLANAYADLVSAYLYPRRFQESEDPEWNLKEGPVTDGFVPKNIGAEDSFFDFVLNNLSDQYGNFVTRHLFDLASFLVPLSRLAAGGDASLWSTFFTKNANDIAKLAANRKNFDADGNGGDYIVDPGMNTLGWIFSALLDANESQDYPKVSEKSKGLINKWNNELSGAPTLSTREVIDAYFLLKNYPEPSLFKPATLELIKGYKYMQNMHMFCDVPSSELALFPVMAQFSHPYHYNVEETRRYRYVAEGRNTEMFLDVIPFDTCRYLYDWLPSTELVSQSFNLAGHQLVFRFALDALLKHAIRYNNEYVFGGHVVGVNNEGYTERLLVPRQVVA